MQRVLGLGVGECPGKKCRDQQSPLGTSESSKARKNLGRVKGKDVDW